MAALSIPFNRPSVVGEEFNYVNEAIKVGHISGDGIFSKRCHALFESVLGVPKALLTCSCTAALEMTAILLDIKPGDEVILPSYTFVSTVNAFVLRGATPIFIDIRGDTLNIDESRLESLITKRTRAIVVVHYAGVACEMDAIMEIADRHQIPVVEDNAHGLFGRYKDRNLGTIGAFGTQSFHETKNFMCGEGGALLINNKDYLERAEIIREKGTDRSRFFRGQVDKYGWVDIGSSFLPSDILAAFLLAQLEKRDLIQNKRGDLWNRYRIELKGWAEHNNVALPFIPEHCEQTYHIFYLILPNLDTRRALISHLKDRGVLSVFHYVPLHTSVMGRKFGGKPGDCPVTEDLSERLLRLPIFYSMTDDEQGLVIDSVKEFSF